MPPASERAERDGRAPITRWLTAHCRRSFSGLTIDEHEAYYIPDHARAMQGNRSKYRPEDTWADKDKNAFLYALREKLTSLRLCISV